MKKSIFKISILAMILGVVFIACEKNIEEQPEELNQIVDDVPTKDAILPEKVDVEPIEIARIQKNGHDYKFVAIGEEGDILVSEELYGNAMKNFEKSGIKIEDKPLDIFLKITDSNVGIPARIAQTSTPALIKASGRKIIDLDVPLKILDPNYSKDNINQKLNCAADVGFVVFGNLNCQAPVISTAANIEFCDRFAQSALTRNSFFGGNWINTNQIYTNTNHCYAFRLQFYSWQAAGWVLGFQVDYFGSGTVTNVLFSAVNTERRVVKTSLVNPGSFRSFTRFQ